MSTRVAKVTKKASRASVAFISDYTSSDEGKGQSKKMSIQHLYDWFKLSPELVGIISAINDDLWGEGYTVDCKSEVKKKKVLSFLKKNAFAQKGYTWTMDSLITGDGFMGKSKLSLPQLSAVMRSVAMDNGIVSEPEIESFAKAAYSRILQKQSDLLDPQLLYNLKSSTMYIDYDKSGKLLGYYQRSDENRYIVDSKTNLNQLETGGATTSYHEPVRFAPEEILHLTHMQLGDSRYGFTPLISSLNDVATLWYAKDFAGKFFEEDATPNYLFLLKNANPQSASHKELISKLESAKGKKHRNMVFTGDLEVKEVSRFNKDMEFKNLIDKLTERLLMAWSMPPSRVSILEGNYRGHLESNEGYYKKINRLQESIEDLLNPGLFEEFGEVDFTFNHAYKRDESRESDIINKLVGRPVFTVNEGRDYLGKKPIAKPEYDEIPEQGMGFNPSGSQTPKPSANTDEEIPTEERISDIAQKVKSMEKSAYKVVAFNDFVRMVEARHGNFDQANIQYLEDNNAFTLFFQDGISEYKTVVSKAEIDSEKFKNEQLYAAIRLLDIEHPSGKIRVIVDGNSTG